MKKVFAFDFWNTVDTPERADVRELIRALFVQGHEIHIVSAISPGLPLDNDESYTKMLNDLAVPFTAIHRVDHSPALKVEVLLRIKADGFWDDLFDNYYAALCAGVPSCYVGHNPLHELRSIK